MGSIKIRIVQKVYILNMEKLLFQLCRLMWLILLRFLCTDVSDVQIFVFPSTLLTLVIIVNFAYTNCLRTSTNVGTVSCPHFR